MEDPSERPARPAPEPGEVVPAGSGIAPNMAGALSYFLGALTGIVFLLVDKERPFVRFHAMQSIVLSVAWVGLWIVMSILSMILSAVPVLGWLIGLLLSIALGIGGFVLWLYLMYRAYSGDEWEVPVVGEYARKFAAQV